MLVTNYHGLINGVWMLDLGLRKVKQEITTPQITLFHRTPYREKHKHRTRTKMLQSDFVSSFHYLHSLLTLTGERVSGFLKSLNLQHDRCLYEIMQ